MESSLENKNKIRFISTQTLHTAADDRSIVLYIVNFYTLPSFKFKKAFYETEKGMGGSLNS